MKASDILGKVRQQKPLVHHLTNWVTIYDCANVVKVFGASPVMAHAPEEVRDMAALAAALVLNIGTLTADFIESMKKAAVAANAKKNPVVLDVCGAGATKFRNDKITELLAAAKIDIIKGNASEIARVAGLDVTTKGVDCGEVKMDSSAVAQALAIKRNCTVVITGKTDVIADSRRILRVDNGHEMMSHVVGTGCMAASAIGTFSAVDADLAQAAAAALCCFGIAAELAAEKSSGPATFKEKLFDAVFLLDEKIVDERQRIKG